MGFLSKLKNSFSSKKDHDRYLSGLEKSRNSFSEKIRKISLNFAGVNEEFLEELCQLRKTIDGFFFNNYDEELFKFIGEKGKLVGLITEQLPPNKILSNINFVKYKNKLYEVQLSREVDENYNPIYGLLELT